MKLNTNPRKIVIDEEEFDKACENLETGKWNADDVHGWLSQYNDDSKPVEAVIVPRDQYDAWWKLLEQYKNNSPGKNAREGMASRIWQMGEDMKKLWDE